jgi:hypothetical protein
MSQDEAFRRALQKLEPTIRDAFLAAIAQLNSNAQIALVEDAIRSGNIARAIAALQLDAAFYAPLDRAISEAYYQGGVMALANLPRLTDPFPVGALCWASMLAMTAPKDGQEDMSET